MTGAPPPEASLKVVYPSGKKRKKPSPEEQLRALRK